MPERTRWRMPLDELRHVTGVDSVITLNEWASAGAFGDRYIDAPSSGRYRHITREMAQRAVIMSRLRKAGIELAKAAAIAKTHKVGDCTDLHVELMPPRPGEFSGAVLIVSREGLP